MKNNEKNSKKEINEDKHIIAVELVNSDEESYKKTLRGDLTTSYRDSYDDILRKTQYINYGILISIAYFLKNGLTHHKGLALCAGLSAIASLILTYISFFQVFYLTDQTLKIMQISNEKKCWDYHYDKIRSSSLFTFYGYQVFFILSALIFFCISSIYFFDFNCICYIFSYF